MARIRTTGILLPLCLTLCFCIGVVLVLYLQTIGHIDLVTSTVSTPRATQPRSFNDIQASSRTSPIPNAAFDLQEALSFLPYGNRQCTKLADFAWPVRYQEAVEAHKEALNKTLEGGVRLEGHSGQFQEQQMVYVKLAQLSFVQTICETGFNAGHSTLIWLASKNSTKVFSFDLGNHEYAKKMAEHLQSKYPGRLTVTWGDSTKTLPEFRKGHPEVKCDLLIVDGGHTVPVATADFENLREMANAGNIVVFDDYPTKEGNGKVLAPVWDTQVRSGTLAEQYACERNVWRGFALGHFLFLKDSLNKSDKKTVQ
ncbi:hypothetical protein CAPTEDRAFT_191993 [Capitella teleta]|uniref:Methyltransferase domain-containing protein n=1 Tax=Capitella teleta TaxID=283909 RepID=R7TGB4_CAPTE|nr:hypothetical protein CAPTEDRAFT_191993 [Capitella teleta]|eukprot:ELT90606.1 hypothetical protein CAPTEDRAFT_191993 [Capitella teleta]